MINIPLEFVLFALTLLGVAVLHRHTLQVAIAGVAAITLYKLAFAGFSGGRGVLGLASHIAHEWVILANLFALLLGFALLSRHFEESKVPDLMPAILPRGWHGGFVLLVLVFALSSFLDNIAAALIGGTVARHVFQGRVGIGYLAALVAAANAGGAGSVVGDTTTTMLWIGGVKPSAVFSAYIASGTALFIFGLIAAHQQHQYQPMADHAPPGLHIDWMRLLIVGVILAAAIITNVAANGYFPALSNRLPLMGFALWGALLATARLRQPDWSVLPEAVRGAAFLLLLVLAASLMPVETLPAASWPTTLGLGFVSAVFDNIPLTALALRQGGYDWGLLAYAVGFGGSMIWFGSSAGVALVSMYPEARSTSQWLKLGWHVALAYAVGFAVMLALRGWQP